MPAQAKDRLGRRGERIAGRFLRWRRRYRIVARNWRTLAGELDLVALDGHVLVFAEVKTRRPDAAALPEDAITPEKMERLRCLAEAFTGRYDLGHLPCRFDVLAVTPRPWPWPARVVHYKDAG